MSIPRFYIEAVDAFNYAHSRSNSPYRAEVEPSTPDDNMFIFRILHVWNKCTVLKVIRVDANVPPPAIMKMMDNDHITQYVEEARRRQKRCVIS